MRLVHIADEIHDTRSVLFIVAITEGILLALMIVASVILVVHQADLYNVTTHLQTSLACHSEQISKLAHNLQIRAAIGDRTRAAQLTLDNAEKAYAPGSAQLKAAYTQFGSVIQAANTQLARTPVYLAQTCR